MSDQPRDDRDLLDLESRLRAAETGAGEGDALARVRGRVHGYVATGASAGRGPWRGRLTAFAVVGVPLAAAAVIAGAILLGSTRNTSKIDVPAGSPPPESPAIVAPSPSPEPTATATPPLARQTAVVLMSRPANQTGPVTVHWVSLDGTDIASQQLPQTEMVLGAGGHRVLVYRNDGHVLDLHPDGTTEEVGSGMPTTSAPGQTSVPVKALVSPDGERWIWGQVVATSGNGTVHSQLKVGGIGMAPRVVVDNTEQNRAVQPIRWVLANPLIAHSAVGLGGYTVYDYFAGQAERLDLATGKQAAVGDGDASQIDVAANSATAEIPSTFSGGNVVVNGPGQRGLTAALPTSGRAGGMMFDPGSNHLVFGFSPAAGPPNEKLETDILDLDSGARTKFGPPNLRPVAWLPDGRLLEVHENTYAGGAYTQAYLVSLNGSATKLSPATEYAGLVTVGQVST
jgi:hypothetical protein